MIGENHCVGYYDKQSGLYVEPKRFYDTEYAPDEIDRWIYADDLIAQADKAERLQKAVDKALQVLDNVSEIGGIDLEMIKIEQMIKENQ